MAEEHEDAEEPELSPQKESVSIEVSIEASRDVKTLLSKRSFSETFVNIL